MTESDRHPTLGTYLREKRDQSGLSIKDLSDSTKISRNQLQVIEADQIEQFPPRAFAMGFIKSYCHEVGADFEHAQQLYAQMMGEQPSAREAEVYPSDQVRQTSEIIGRSTSLSPYIFGVLAVALVSGAMYFYWNGTSADQENPSRSSGYDAVEDVRQNGGMLADTRDQVRSDSTEETHSDSLDSSPNALVTNPDSAETADASAPAQDSDEHTFASTIADTPDDSAIAPDEPVAPDSTRSISSDNGDVDADIQVQVEGISKAWVKLVGADGETRTDILDMGQIIRLNSPAPIVASLGNAGGVRVIVDSYDQGTLGNAGDVKRFALERNAQGETQLRMLTKDQYLQMLRRLGASE